MALEALRYPGDFGDETREEFIAEFAVDLAAELIFASEVERPI